MKHAFCFFLAILACGPAAANSNFVTNPRLPYPPACVQDMNPQDSGFLDARGIKFHEAEIGLFDAQSGDRIPVTLAAYRTPCAEPGRSLIWIELTLLADDAKHEVELELPTFMAEPRQNWRYGMNLVTEPNGWGGGGHVEKERRYLASEPQAPAAGYGSSLGDRRWVFLLDNGPDDLPEFRQPGLTASEYNAAFRLWLRYPPYDYLSIEVPAISDLLPAAAPPLPLSGRLSGTWVIEGAANQGIQLSIAEQVGERKDFAPGVPELPLLLFFSQYTFDAQWQPLWLVGNVEFRPGATEVTLPVFLVTGGRFRGDAQASRERAGTIMLRSLGCNNVVFRYDYSGIGLGKGRKRMQRLFSLETAGYDCRDYEARVVANQ